MKISEIKTHLSALGALTFRLPDGNAVPEHFHLTEVGLVTRHFIDCGGTERTEQVANFQLWTANDYEHRLAPEKFLRILDISKKVLGNLDPEIEVEYQQGTIAKFGLAFDGREFILTNKQTACLALDACGLPPAKSEKTEKACAASTGCC